MVFSGCVDEIVIVCSDSTLCAAQNASCFSSVPVKIVYGGSRRQDSVHNGICATDADVVAIHDCARFLVSADVIREAIRSACRYGSGVAAIKVRDTLRISETGETVPRENVVQMQTPQCFDRIRLLKAYENELEATDDAMIWQKAYGHVRLTEGSLANQKLTEKDDIDFFERMTGGADLLRIGIGEDTHRLVEGRKLIIGGIEIPYSLGLLGHSDADVLTHAIIDALLGAAALGDIGRHFPDSDPQYKGISSMILLEKTIELIDSHGYRVSNIDAVIIAQEPKLAPFIDTMRKKIADVLNVGMEFIGIKATTPEHLGPEGNLECITVRAVAVINGIR